MPWRVGIDEAGYGPNLGPLVMSAVACRTPAGLTEPSLWKVLRKAVRRSVHKGPHRLVVDDSKLVYSTARGLGDLETSVLSILLGSADHLPATLAHLVQQLHPGHDLGDEAWYTGATPLPLAIGPGALTDGAARFRAACAAAEVQWLLFRSVIVCPPRFNSMLDRWGSKGAVLSLGLNQLLEPVAALEPPEPVTIVVDKHGGRNHYGPVLQEAFPDAWVVPVEEGMESSAYVIQGLQRAVSVTFCPRADQSYFEAALASMLSKYVREALMSEFNGFWKGHVPDLAPTAGYPGDSSRFLEEIRPALARLNIAEELVWRRR
jgi:ribonuclease HII